MPRDVLGKPEKEKAARPHRIVEQRDDLRLGLRLQIDQQIAARDQVDARERWIANDAVVREDAHVAHLPRHAKAPCLGYKEAPEPFGRDILGQYRQIARRPREAQRGFIDVGGENLQPPNDPQLVHLLTQKDRNRVGLLAARATGHPDAKLIVHTLAFEELWNDQGFESVEGSGVTEEIGDTDQEVAKQGADLFRL